MSTISEDETVIDVRLYQARTALLQLEYSTTMSTLRTLVRQQGCRITRVEYSQGKVDVYVTPRYKGTDPYTGRETYAGYRPKVGRND